MKNSAQIKIILVMVICLVIPIISYSQAGSLDKTFGTNGIAITSIREKSDYCSAVALQKDGKIVVAGTSMLNSTKSDFALIRYNLNGNLDSSFGNNGIVVTKVGIYDNGNSVVIQKDGKIIVGGSSDQGRVGTYDFSLVRYLNNGSIDSTFGNNGIVINPISLGNDEGYALAIQNDGKIILAGECEGKGYNILTGESEGSGYHFALVRFNTNGSLDYSFGNNGKVSTSFGYEGTGRSIAIQTDGKILVAGQSSAEIAIECVFTIVRYTIDGSIDSTFGINGKVFSKIETSFSFGRFITLQTDGKILLAGESYKSVGGTSDFAIVRYNKNGSLDSTFGNNGIVVTPVGTTDDFVSSIAIQSDGCILVAGTSNKGVDIKKFDNDFSLVRYNMNGILDSTFGKNGIVITEVGNLDGNLCSVSILSDGKILLTGNSCDGMNGFTNFTLAKYISIKAK